MQSEWNVRTGVDDKRQITVVICATASGIFLPFQIIYQGKTPACLPRFVFPDNWNACDIYTKSLVK